MTSREATIYYLKQLKGQPFKEQISYILTNFWIPIVAVLAVIAVLFSLIVHWTTHKPTALTLCCINAISEDQDTADYLQQFAKAHGINTDKYTLRTERFYFGHGADTDYQYFETFIIMQMAGDLDVAVAEDATVITYAYEGWFSDLTSILTQEQLVSLQPYFLYVDLSLLETKDELTEEAPVYPDPTKPEEMVQPIPVAIQLQPDWVFTSACYPHTYEKNAIALFANSKNRDNAEAFLQYILNHKG